MTDLLMKRDAIISTCGLYRYRLSRSWDDGPEATFIMLNPSAADASIDDPTIRKCIGFAQRWGLSGINVGNLFAYRATQPADMMKARDPVGPENRDHLEWMCERAAKNGGTVVCAWGAKGSHMEQDKTFLGWMIGLSIRPKALRITRKSSAPEHPLYVPYDALPIEYVGWRTNA